MSSRRSPHFASSWSLVSALLLSGALSVACTRQDEPPPAAPKEEVRLSTAVIAVEGMSCAACAARVKKTLAAVDGVAEAHVDLGERRATVRFVPSKVSVERLVSAVKDLGYEARPGGVSP